MAATAQATRANLDGVKLSSLVYNVYDQTRLRSLLYVMPNMLNGQPIASYTGADNITTSATTCTAGTPSDVLKETVKLIEFKEFEVNATFCAKELLGKMVAKGMKPDSSPDEVGEVVSQLVSNGAELDLIRLAWLGDTAAASDTFASGVPLAKYNLKDGFYKQILAGVTAKTIKKITLDKDDITANVRAAKRALHFSARKDAKLFVTSGIYDLIENLTIGQANSDAQMRLIDGVSKLYFLGIEVVELEEVSAYINADYATPFDFAVLCPLEMLAVPMDRENIEAQSWDKDASTKKWYLQAAYQADFKIANNAKVVLIGA